MGFYHDKQEYEALNARFAGDMRAFKQKVVQVIANASYDPDTTWFPSDPMDELDVDEFLQELMEVDEDDTDDDDDNPFGVKWDLRPPAATYRTNQVANSNQFIFSRGSSRSI